MSSDFDSIRANFDGVLSISSADKGGHVEKARNITGKEFHTLGIGIFAGVAWRLPGLTQLPLERTYPYSGVVGTLDMFLQEHLLPMLQPYSFLTDYPRRPWGEEEERNGAWSQKPYTDPEEIKAAMDVVRTCQKEAIARLAAQQITKEDTALAQSHVALTKNVCAFFDSLELLRNDPSAQEDEDIVLQVGALVGDGLLWPDPRNLGDRVTLLLGYTCKP